MRIGVTCLTGTACILASIYFVGCGVSKSKIDDAERRINSLSSKGAPDTLLSKLRIYVFNTKTQMKLGNSPSAKRYFDSLQTRLVATESRYESTVQKLQPEIESMMSAFKDKMKNLNGQQLKVAESSLKTIDSLKGKNLFLEAKDKSLLLDSIMIWLQKDQVKADNLKKTILGTWNSTRTPEGNKFKAVEKRSITFNADGKVHIIEEMKGQTSDEMKEDWKYVSDGTWDASGDTALIFVKKERCERLMYWVLDTKSGKKNNWIKKDKPPYDSTITDGRKDKFMLLEDITKNFDKAKK